MSKVVIFLGDGALQGILAESWLTDLLILDTDIKGVDQGDPGLKEFDGEVFYVGRRVDLVDPDYVAAIFEAVVED